MALVKEILNYTPEQWQANQKLIVERVKSGREYLGLEQEWVADKAGYSITHYKRLEHCKCYCDIEDFLRIGEVFYHYQESLSPPYIQTLNRWKLWLKISPYRIREWVEELQR